MGADINQDADSVDPTVHELTVGEGHEGDRLDVVVAANVAGVSRSAAQRLIKAGQVTVAGRLRPQGFRVPAGAAVIVRIPAPATDSPPIIGPVDLDVLYEDDSLVIVNKPPGLVVHPGAGHRFGTLADRLLASGRALSVVGGTDRAGLVHRLDRYTSGVLMAAKNDQAHEALAAQFKERTISKAYLTLVLGVSMPDREVINTRFGRSPGNRKQFTGRVSTGREAVTSYRTLMRANLCALLLVRPRTGRTHQIRVHLSERGYPVAGDRVYGRAFPRKGSQPRDEALALMGLKRQALHAYALRFIHPVTGHAHTVKAPLPRDMRRVLEAVFGDGCPADIPDDPFGAGSESRRLR
ncbi:MAG: RluA family pseudouridine synthase [Deltaproteobacteria bacterium]|nr:RluA family pseudouridine synthase [Deltaproteobacteria bacterium]